MYDSSKAINCNDRKLILKKVKQLKYMDYINKDFLGDTMGISKDLWDQVKVPMSEGRSMHCSQVLFFTRTTYSENF